MSTWRAPVLISRTICACRGPLMRSVGDVVAKAWVAGDDAPADWSLSRSGGRSRGVAAEMMVRSTARFSHLVLVDPLGIKISGREGRDIADMHALPRAEYLRLAWADPAKGDIDFTQLSESELAVRGREAFALYERVFETQPPDPPSERNLPVDAESDAPLLAFEG